MGELRASLYDIFGYFLPGLVAAASVRLLFWVCFYPTVPLSIQPFAIPGVLTAVAVVAYLVGHLLHAIGNELPITHITKRIRLTQPTGWRRLFVISEISQEVMQLAERNIETRFGAHFGAMSSSEKLTLMDEARVLHERDNEREVYIYREGFYRGMTVACAFLLVALAASLTTGQLTLLADSTSYAVRWNERLALVPLVAIAGFLFWKRMHRFAHYRTSRSLFLWLVTSTSTPSPNTSSDAK